jgi:hypothetical protein
VIKTTHYTKLALAEEEEGRTLSLGRCPDRCTYLQHRMPLCWAWTGTDPASSKRCPICGEPLKRMSRWNWDGYVAILPAPKRRRGRPRKRINS